MNKPPTQSEFETPKVTTGALPASRKVYTHPVADPTLSVPRREIDLHPTANEPPVPVTKSAPSAESGPCSQYRVDLTGAVFGQCKCGFAKAEHAPSAFGRGK